jgi:hypothetical protein
MFFFDLLNFVRMTRTSVNSSVWFKMNKNIECSR